MTAEFRGAGHDVDVVRAHGDERPVADGAGSGPSDAGPAGPDVLIVLDPSVAADANGGPSSHTAESAGGGPPRPGGRVARVIHVVGRTVSGAGDTAFSGEDGSTVETVRTSLVYGTGTDPVTQLLIMMRSLPVVPLPPRGHVVRPLWHGDLARVVRAVAERPADGNGTIEVTGPEAVTWEHLYEVMAHLIDRSPPKLAVPEFLTEHGAKLVALFGDGYPVARSPLLAPTDEADDGASGAARRVGELTGESPLRLEDGLPRLIRDLSEITPVEGTGSIEVKVFGATIRGSRFDAPTLIREFRARFDDVMPIDIGVEPVLPATRLDPDAVISMHLPGRGHVQVRVEEVGERHVMLATARGHVLAGVVRFSAHDAPAGVRFEVLVCDAAANPVDWVALGAGGTLFQDANWTRVVQNVVAFSGGRTDGVHGGQRHLDGDEALRVQRGIRRVIERNRTGEGRGQS